MPAAHRLGACIGVPLMAGAVAAVGVPSAPGRPDPGPPSRPAPGRAHDQSGRLLASDAQRRAGPTPLAARQPVHRGALPHVETVDGSWPRPSTPTRSPSGAASWTCRPIPPGSPRRSQPGTPSSSRRRRAPRACRSAWCAPPPSGWPTNRGRCSPPDRSSASSASATPRCATSERRRGPSTASACCRSPTPSPVRPWAGPWPSRGPTCSGPPAPTTTSTSSSTPRPTSGSRSAYLDLDKPVGQGASRAAPGRRRRRGRQLPPGLARAPRPRSARPGRPLPRDRVRLGQLLRPERPVGATEGAST